MITRWNLDELYHGDDELYHHGVLGMRWGHRKAENSSNKRSDSSKTARRKRIARNVAIGVGAAAAVGGGLYLAKKKGLIGGKTGAQAMREVSRPSANEKIRRYDLRKTFPVDNWHTINTPKLNPLNHKLRVSNKVIVPDNKAWWQSKSSVRINAIRSGSGSVNRLISNNKSRSIGTLKVARPIIERPAFRKFIYKPAANTPKAYDIGFKGNHQMFNIPSGLKRLR